MGQWGWDPQSKLDIDIFPKPTVKELRRCLLTGLTLACSIFHTHSRMNSEENSKCRQRWRNKNPSRPRKQSWQQWVSLGRGWERRDLPSHYPDFYQPSKVPKTLLDYLKNVFFIIRKVSLRNHSIPKPEKQLAFMKHQPCVRHCALSLRLPATL